MIILLTIRSSMRPFLFGRGPATAVRRQVKLEPGGTIVDGLFEEPSRLHPILGHPEQRSDREGFEGGTLQASCRSRPPAIVEGFAWTTKKADRRAHLHG